MVVYFSDIVSENTDTADVHVFFLHILKHYVVLCSYGFIGYRLIISHIPDTFNKKNKQKKLYRIEI